MTQLTTTRSCYYMILFVYISLWMCQVITCHLTHSLIVLTDSYINLYKILDISLGILHLKTQHRVRDCKLKSGADITNGSNGPPATIIRLFDTVCTYDFKRLPVLGSFVNGLFLAALLMSAAIEGIQTCFHAHHSGQADDQASILLEHPITYPGLLVGFALVGAMMQWCTMKAHEMREQELGSESLLNIQASCQNSSPSQSPSPTAGRLNELDAGKLSAHLNNSNHSNSHQSLSKIARKLSPNHSQSRPLSANCFETVPLDDDEDKRLPAPPPTPSNDQFTRISLKSLKLDTIQGRNVDDGIAANSLDATINSISKDLEAEGSGGKRASSICDRWWLIVRYCVSPVALISCALIIYFIHDELVTEIADATFAILVVILLFTASYPPMRKAGKVLLQAAPEGVDLVGLKRSLKSISPIVEDIRELHVWSLTAGSNRIATCHLIMNKDKIQSGEQVSNLLRQAKSKFLNQNIKCSTIQPILIDNSTTRTLDNSNSVCA